MEIAAMLEKTIDSSLRALSKDALEPWQGAVSEMLVMEKQLPSIKGIAKMRQYAEEQLKQVQRISTLKALESACQEMLDEDIGRDTVIEGHFVEALCTAWNGLDSLVNELPERHWNLAKRTHEHLVNHIVAALKVESSLLVVEKVKTVQSLLSLAEQISKVSCRPPLITGASSC